MIVCEMCLWYLIWHGIGKIIVYSVILVFTYQCMPSSVAGVNLETNYKPIG